MNKAFCLVLVEAFGAAKVKPYLKHVSMPKRTNYSSLHYGKCPMYQSASKQLISSLENGVLCQGLSMALTHSTWVPSRGRSEEKFMQSLLPCCHLTL